MVDFLVFGTQKTVDRKPDHGKVVSEGQPEGVPKVASEDREMVAKQKAKVETSTPVKTEVLATSNLAPVVKLSDEQTAIARWVMTGKGNLLVVARAGTGKTFLLRQCIKLMSGQIAVCAYNSKIAKEIREKLLADNLLRSERDRLLNKSGADVGTFHAYGWQVVRKLLPSIRLEGYEQDQAGFYKFPVIADRLNIPAVLRNCVKKAMTHAQERCVGVLCPMNDRDAWLDIADHYGLESELPEGDAASVIAQTLGIGGDDWRQGLVKVCLQYALKALRMSLDMARENFKRERTYKKGGGRGFKSTKGEEFTGVISFGEMLYLPLIWNMPIPQYDWVLVDEAQDSNPARREMGRRMLKTGGRMMWVGDDRQAIYGFSGADSDALEQIAKAFRCAKMPMTMTFRCAKAVVREVNDIVPDYKAADVNPEGEVLSIDEETFFKTQLFAERENGTGDAIICRNTKPLVDLAYKLIANDVPVHVEGKDIGKGLIALMDRWPNLKNFPALIDKLNEYREREIAVLQAKKQEMLADALNDRVETVLAMIAAMPKGSTVPDLKAKIEALFIDTDGKAKGTVTLLTAHRSKGLEYTRVFLLGENKYMPSSYARQEWQLEQEENLRYVAKTRAIITLTKINVAA